MGLRDKIATAMKETANGKDGRALCTVRLIQTAVKDRDIANRAAGKDPVSDEEIEQILIKMVRQREESAKAYEDAARLELAQQEREEIAVIKRFLPEQLSEEAVQKVCASIVKETGAQGLRDMGKCMNKLKERYPGRMDFTKASGMVKGMLR